MKLTPAQHQLLVQAAAPKPSNSWSTRGDGRVSPWSSGRRPCETLEKLGLVQRRSAHTDEELADLRAQQDLWINSAKARLAQGAWRDAFQALSKAALCQRKIEQQDYFVTDAGYAYLKGKEAL